MTLEGAGPAAHVPASLLLPTRKLKSPVVSVCAARELTSMIKPLMPPKKLV